jgi:hypothetical protein
MALRAVAEPGNYSILSRNVQFLLQVTRNKLVGARGNFAILIFLKER